MIADAEKILAIKNRYRLENTDIARVFLEKWKDVHRLFFANTHLEKYGVDRDVFEHIASYVLQLSNIDTQTIINSFSQKISRSIYGSFFGK